MTITPPPPTASSLSTSPPSRFVAWRELATMFVHEMATVGRFVALGGLGVVLIVLGFASRFADDPLDAGAGILAELGVGIVAPIVTLVLASATLGQLRSDGTLVYVWLRPVPRSIIALAAATATLVVAIPAVVVPAAIAAVLVGAGADLLMAAIWASVVTTVGYTAVFIPLGASSKRSFIIGLVYVLVWGGLLARLGTGFAAVSVQSYGVAAIEEIADVALSGGNHSLTAVFVVPLVFLVIGMGFTTWQLNRREID